MLFGALSFLCVCVCLCYLLFVLVPFFCQTVVECVELFFFGNWDFIFITRDNQLDLPILIRSFPFEIETNSSTLLL